MSSTVGERQSLDVYSLNALLGFIWSVDGFDAILKIAIIKHIDIEDFSTWFYAQNDMPTVSSYFIYQLSICSSNIGVNVSGKEALTVRKYAA